MTPPSNQREGGWRDVWRDPRLHAAALALYYFAIIAALVFLYGGGNLQPPSFVYQGF